MQMSLKGPNKDRAAIALAGDQPTILFVDDDERILRSLRMLFAQQYNVRVTTDGYAALKILAEEKIHVLVSDQRMPIMAGVELLRLAKAEAPNTMRLLLTGYSDIEAILASINEGEVFRFVTKPWDVDAIKNTIASAVEIAISLDSLNIPNPPREPIVAERIHVIPENRQTARNIPSLEHGDTADGILTIKSETAGSVRILVIDESPQTAEDIRSLVHGGISDRVSVDWAGSLDAVLETLERYEVALVISEARLGNMDITVLIKTLKRFNPKTISILLTSFQDSSTLIGLINQAQIFRCLPKPLGRNMMLRSIKAGLQSYQSFQMTPALVNRHTVETAPEPVGNMLASRILGFFRSVAGQRS